MTKIVNNSWTTNDVRLGHYNYPYHMTLRKRGALYIDKNNAIYAYSNNDHENTLISWDNDIVLEIAKNVLQHGETANRTRVEELIKSIEQSNSLADTVDSQPSSASADTLINKAKDLGFANPKLAANAGMTNMSNNQVKKNTVIQNTKKNDYSQER